MRNRRLFRYRLLWTFTNQGRERIDNGQRVGNGAGLREWVIKGMTAGDGAGLREWVIKGLTAGDGAGLSVKALAIQSPGI